MSLLTRSGAVSGSMKTTSSSLRPHIVPWIVVNGIVLLGSYQKRFRRHMLRKEDVAPEVPEYLLFYLKLT